VNPTMTVQAKTTLDLYRVGVDIEKGIDWDWDTDESDADDDDCRRDPSYQPKKSGERKRGATKQRTKLKATSFALRPYGVLGNRLGLAGITQEAPGPTANLCAFCDPAGLRYIQEYGPQGASGASGSIYAWLGISEQKAFPPDVVNAIVKETDAKAFVYDVHGKGRAICIHVVGPQFGRSRATNEGYAAAVETLSVAYENVLKEFSVCEAPALRLLPISGGIFAGHFLDKIALLTIDSLGRACERIQAANPAMAALLGAKQLDMCVFSEKEWKQFQGAWSTRRSQGGGGRSRLGAGSGCGEAGRGKLCSPLVTSPPLSSPMPPAETRSETFPAALQGKGKEPADEKEGEGKREGEGEGEVPKGQITASAAAAADTDTDTDGLADPSVQRLGDVAKSTREASNKTHEMPEAVSAGGAQQQTDGGGGRVAGASSPNPLTSSPPPPPPTPAPDMHQRADWGADKASAEGGGRARGEGSGGAAECAGGGGAGAGGGGEGEGGGGGGGGVSGSGELEDGGRGAAEPMLTGYSMGVHPGLPPDVANPAQYQHMAAIYVEVSLFVHRTLP